MTEYEIWAKKLKELNNHINNLKEWNDYAEDCQREYDFLLSQEPKRTEKDTSGTN